MTRNGRHDEHDDLGPDTVLDFELAEPVEFAPDFHVALTVPFRGDNLAKLEGLAKELGVTPIEAAEQLIEQGLAARSASAGD